jgi:nicotinamide-nucleotide amidase
MALTMSAEIITFGSELLHGLVRDTNAERIAEQLASIGIDVIAHTTVGDETARMGEALRTAGHRASVVVTTGGLGATPDDLTRKTIATVFRRRLVLDEAVLERMRARFRERGVPMPTINESQALIPRGSRLIENPRGLAPGLHFAHVEAEYFCLPGVPSEADAMMESYVLPYLRTRVPSLPLARYMVRTVGISETALAERLQAIASEEERVRIGYLPHPFGVDITIAATALDQAWAVEALERTERKVRELAGEHVYGTGKETLSAAVGALLAERKITLAIAESVTGGAVSAAVTESPGASRYLLGAIVAYGNRAKQEILGVQPRTLERHGAVSAEVAEAMAEGVRERFGADLALSTTGIAGPDGGSAEKPVGLVYLGLSSREGTRSVRHLFSGIRSEVVARSAAYALDLARRHLALSPV